MDPGDLRRLRAAFHLTQAEAAELVHVTPNAWQKWEAGDRAVNQTAAHLFCLLLGVCYPWSSKADPGSRIQDPGPGSRSRVQI